MQLLSRLLERARSARETRSGSTLARRARAFAPKKHSPRVTAQVRIKSQLEEFIAPTQPARLDRLERNQGLKPPRDGVGLFERGLGVIAIAFPLCQRSLRHPHAIFGPRIVKGTEFTRDPSQLALRLM